MPRKNYVQDGVQCIMGDYNDEMCSHSVLFCLN